MGKYSISTLFVVSALIFFNNQKNPLNEESQRLTDINFILAGMCENRTHPRSS